MYLQQISFNLWLWRGKDSIRSEASVDERISIKDSWMMIICGKPDLLSLKGIQVYFSEIELIWFISLQPPMKPSFTVHSDKEWFTLSKIRKASISTTHPHIFLSILNLSYFHLFLCTLTPSPTSNSFFITLKKNENEMRKFSDPWNDKSQSLTRIDDTDTGML